MKIDQLLTKAQPRDVARDNAFTDRVMHAISKSQQPEINHSLKRMMNVTNRKETFIMKLRALPLTLVIVLAIIAVTTFSAGAYAIYQLLFQPSVTQTRETTSASGRTELAFDISNCGNNIATRYELKKNATISKERVASIVKAQCEQNLIQEWFTSITPKDYERHATTGAGMKAGETRDGVVTNFAIPTQITHITPNTIVTDENEKLTPTDNTIYVIDGVQSPSPEKLKPGDPIMYLTFNNVKHTAARDCTENSCSHTETPTSSRLVAVVKLAQAFSAYDPRAAASIIELIPCMGNTDSVCRQGNIGGIPFITQDVTISKETEVRSIEGELVSSTTNSFRLKASSGKIYTVKTSFDRIANFNVNRSSDYDGKTIEVGDTIALTYYQQPDQSSRIIPDSSIIDAMIRIEIISKGDAINKF